MKEHPAKGSYEALDILDLSGSSCDPNPIEKLAAQVMVACFDNAHPGQNIVIALSLPQRYKLYLYLSDLVLHTYRHDWLRSVQISDLSKSRFSVNLKRYLHPDNKYHWAAKWADNVVADWISNLKIFTLGHCGIYTQSNDNFQHNGFLCDPPTFEDVCYAPALKDHFNALWHDALENGLKKDYNLGVGDLRHDFIDSIFDFVLQDIKDFVHHLQEVHDVFLQKCDQSLDTNTLRMIENQHNYQPYKTQTQELLLHYLSQMESTLSEEGFRFRVAFDLEDSHLTQPEAHIIFPDKIQEIPFDLDITTIVKELQDRYDDRWKIG
jgi:hypothetical protein